MGVPTFLLRKLYKRGSLRETADGCFGFKMQNPLATAHLTGAPKFVVNGVSYTADQVSAGPHDLAAISEDNPFRFAKGMAIEIVLPGRLLRGGNRIHITAESKEFGRIDFLVEDREASFCDLPDRSEE